MVLVGQIKGISHFFRHLDLSLSKYNIEYGIWNLDYAPTCYSTYLNSLIHACHVAHLLMLDRSQPDNVDKRTMLR